MNTPIAPDQLASHWKARLFTIWSGQALSLVGSALVQFALVWWLTVKTGSATILATATLMALLPQMVLGPFAGTLVDRWNRRAIMIVADSAIALSTVVLIALFATERISVWHVYVLMFARSLGGAFHYPAMASSTSLMVPRQYLARVAGMNQALQGIVKVFAPPLGALLLALMPMQGVLAIDVGTALVAVLLLLFIAVPQPARRRDEQTGLVQETTYWQELREGFR
jgi:MFS transporter, DHA3 family, macrolide efflux protein